MIEHTGSQTIWALPLVTTVEKDNRGIVDLANTINSWAQEHGNEFSVMGWEVASTYGTVNATVKYMSEALGHKNLTQALPIVGKIKSNEGWAEIVNAINFWQRSNPGYIVDDWKVVVANGTINALVQVYGPPLPKFEYES